jgi:hypothetical protein
MAADVTRAACHQNRHPKSSLTQDLLETVSTTALLESPHHGHYNPVTGVHLMWHRAETKVIHRACREMGIGHDPPSLGTGAGRGILTKMARWTTIGAIIIIPRKTGKPT